MVYSGIGESGVGHYTMMTSSNGSFTALLAFCVGNSPVTGEFPSQRASNADFGVALMRVRISC